MKIIEKAFYLALLTMTVQCYAFNPYTTSELDQLEKEFVQQINQAESVERNPLVTNYINHLGNKLASAAHLPKPHFFVVKSNEINAFAGPGGHIGINTRLILTTDSESELAAVMAHELAHVRLHHLYYLIQHEKRMRIPMIASLLAAVALSAINPALGSAAAVASLTGFSQENINYIRSGEKEADRIGIDMLARAGFDTHGMVSFFKKMQLNTRYYYTDNIPPFLRTHPLDQDRIAEALNRIATRPRVYQEEPLDYQLVKVIIRTSTTHIEDQQLKFYRNECKKIYAYQVCQYGLALSYIHLNYFNQAETVLTPLVNEAPKNIFYQLALAEAETGNKDFVVATKRLHQLQLNDPENYAIIRSLTHTLMVAGEAQKAVPILLKAFRYFKGDLPLCEALSRAQSDTGNKNYAYFTDAQCQLLQGRSREAARQLRLVIKSSKKDPYLLARATALLDEIKSMQES